MKKGIESLREAIKNSCKTGENCFNESGCDRKGHIKCFHKYCDKYAWIIDRAKTYANCFNLDYEEILAKWEEARNYNVMNYYQECNQPKLDNPKVITLEQWNNKGRSLFGDDKMKWKFVCPVCKNIQTPEDLKKAGANHVDVLQECVGRYDKTKGCDYAAYGLFKRTNTKVISEHFVPTDMFDFAE